MSHIQKSAVTHIKRFCHIHGRVMPHPSKSALLLLLLCEQETLASECAQLARECDKFGGVRACIRAWVEYVCMCVCVWCVCVFSVENIRGWVVGWMVGVGVGVCVWVCGVENMGAYIAADAEVSSTRTYLYVCAHVFNVTHHVQERQEQLSTISRLRKIIGLFCKRAL